MGISVLDPPSIRLRIELNQASDELFSRLSQVLSRLSREDIDGVCIDADLYQRDDCLRWVAKGRERRLQVFVAGSRESLASWQGLEDVTLVEKDDSLAAASAEQLPAAVSQKLQEIYAPFRDVEFGFVSGEEDESMPKHASGEKGARQPVDPSYLREVLTEKQDKELLAFLRKPEGQDSPPPGAENA
ncbi:MAG: hypothetical protein WCA49_09025 [Candidatus Sulfotelmatobacter sp.]